MVFVLFMPPTYYLHVTKHKNCIFAFAFHIPVFGFYLIANSMSFFLFRPCSFSKVTAFFILFNAVFLVLSCGTNNSPDVSHLKADVHIQRFEQDLFSIDTTQNTAAQLHALAQKYPDFFGLFVAQIMAFGEPSDTAKMYPILLSFIKNTDMRYLYDTCMVQYPNLSDLEADLSQSFKYVQYYLPQQHVPQVISHISAFGPAAVTVDDELLAINLDMYMGDNFAPYNSSEFPRYLSKRFRREYIVPNSLRAYAKGIYSMTDKELPRLIDQMVYEGKLLYFLDLVLPNTPDSLKIGYTQADLAWCAKSEPEIWAFLLEQELLYNTHANVFYKYLEEAPNTNGMPTESPGRVGVWVGWQIVRHFMQQNPNTTFDELMGIKDGQTILKQAKYKPKR
jgi:hypothetical protein